jgi:hypothetical protein
MGNTASGPPGLSAEAQKEARNKFYTKVGALLGGKRLPDKENMLGCIFAVEGKDNMPPHYVIVTHGFAWGYGTEMVVRYFAENDTKAEEMDAAIEASLNMIYSMQETAKFRSHESCEVMFPLPFENCTQGTHGAVVVEDSLLHGTHYKPGDEFLEDGFLCDDNFWPQHFLDIYFLRPPDYTVTHAVPMRGLVEIIKMRSPHLINDFCAGCVVNDPVTAAALAELKLSSPARCALDGLTLDARIRKDGREADLVLGGRWMAPVLEALQEAFNKATVPKGTLVTIVDEKSTCVVTFVCHDNEGNLVTPDTAFFRVEEVDFANPDGSEVELSPEDKRAYTLLPAGVLWAEKNLIRQMQLTFYFPAEFMAVLIEGVRSAVSRRPDHAWDENPMILSWETMFVGKNGKSGFNSDIFGPPAAVGCDQPRAKFRFICAGMNYFEDEVLIDDDGMFQAVEGGDDDEEEEEEEEGNVNGPEEV